MTLPLALLLGLLPSAFACDVGYDFGPYADKVSSDMRVTLTWWTVEPVTKANTYLSTATGTACNSGYFGAQFHSDGKGGSSQSVLFSLWDAPHRVGLQNNSEFPFQALPAGGNCWRNALDASGKSTGVQCGQPWTQNKSVEVNVSFHFGVPYEFRLAIIGQNSSGALWEVSMFDPSSKSTISVGKIFLVDVPLNLPTTCRALGKAQDPPTPGLSSYTFLEYFSPPFDYTTVATWSDMRAYGPNDTVYQAPGVAQDCCGRTYGAPPTGGFLDTSRHCVPPECDALEVQMMCGPFVKPSKAAIKANPGCEKESSPQRLGKSMQDCWRHGSPASLDECFGREKATATVVI